MNLKKTIMCKTIRQTERKARKEYPDDAAIFIIESGLLNESGVFKIKDLRTLVLAKQQRWHIIKGTKYTEVVFKDGSKLHTARFGKDLDGICREYDLYEG